MQIQKLLGLFIGIMLLLFSMESNGQSKPIFLQEFDRLTEERTSDGISGFALNLTKSAKIRTPFDFTIDSGKWNNSFTISSWIKAVEDFEEYQILELKVSYEDSSEVSWQINKEVNHTWSMQISQGKTVWNYKPSYKNQTICKDWNLITLSYDAIKNEVSLYYNDRQVAIYSLEGLDLNNKVSSIKLNVGGSYFGEIGEWKTFNGLLDEVQVFNTALTNADIVHYYQSFKKKSFINSSSTEIDSLRIMSFNIWHGGNETGKSIGHERIVSIIKSSSADIICMQETYGSGAKIADELGYYFYLRGSNISIMSRYPILETLPSANAFNNGNVHIQVGRHKVAIASVWLNYPIDYWSAIDKGEKLNIDIWKEKQLGNKKTMESIVEVLKNSIENSDQIPLVIAGDFNSGSHLDYIEATKHYNAGYVMPFPTSLYLQQLGFRDSFREVYPNPLKNRGITWSPLNSKTHQDRIDYIYLKGNKIRVLDSKIIDTSNFKYPSDHAAILTTILL